MKFAPKRGNSSSPPKREEQRCPFRARLWGARDLGCSKKKAEETLGRGELGHGLGALRDGVLGELSREDQAHGGLDLPRGDRRLLVVARELGGLGGDLGEWWRGRGKERERRERGKKSVFFFDVEFTASCRLKWKTSSLCFKACSRSL